MLWRVVFLGVLSALLFLLFVLVPDWSRALAHQYEDLQIKEGPWFSEVLLRIGPILRVPYWIPIALFAGIAWPTLRGRLDRFMRAIIAATMLVFVMASLGTILALRPIHRVGIQRCGMDPIISSQTIPM